MLTTLLPGEDPERLGEFTLRFRLGAGGFGRVYLAVDRDNRAAAIKLIHRHHADTPDIVRRFGQEAEATLRVGGHHVPRLVGWSNERDSRCWVATAYVPAPTVYETIDGREPLPPAAVRYLGAGICSALEDISEAGLVHRDLTPTNVLISALGAQVIDLGLSRFLDENAARLTQPNHFAGNVKYMAPEMVNGLYAGSAEADVYGLGATLLYAATGHAPHSGPSLAACLEQLRSEHADLTGLPSELNDIIVPCLASNPGDRPSLAELRALLPSRAEGAVVRAAALPDWVGGMIDQRLEELQALLGGALLYTRYLGAETVEWELGPAVEHGLDFESQRERPALEKLEIVGRPDGDGAEEPLANDVNVDVDDNVDARRVSAGTARYIVAHAAALVADYRDPSTADEAEVLRLAGLAGMADLMGAEASAALDAARHARHLSGMAGAQSTVLLEREIAELANAAYGAGAVVVELSPAGFTVHRLTATAVGGIDVESKTAGWPAALAPDPPASRSKLSDRDASDRLSLFLAGAAGDFDGGRLVGRPADEPAFQATVTRMAGLVADAVGPEIWRSARAAARPRPPAGNHADSGFTGADDAPRVRIAVVRRVLGWAALDALVVMIDRLVHLALDALLPGAGAFADFLREVVACLPLRWPLELVVARIGPDDRVVPELVPLFPVGKAPRDEHGRRRRIDVRVPRGSRQVELPIVARKGPEPGDWETVASWTLDDAGDEPAALIARFAARDRVEFEARQGLRRSAESWASVRRRVPHFRHRASGDPLDLVVAVELGSADLRIERRLEYAQRALDGLGRLCDQGSDIRVSIIAYGDHVLDGRARSNGTGTYRMPSPERPGLPQPIVRHTAFTKPAAAAQVLDGLSPMPVSDDLAAPVEDVLIRLTGAAWRPAARRGVLFIGSRPPHPPQGTSDGVVPCPQRADWEPAYSMLNARTPIVCMAALEPLNRHLDSKLRKDPSWEAHQAAAKRRWHPLVGPRVAALTRLQALDLMRRSDLLATVEDGSSPLPLPLALRAG